MYSSSCNNITGKIISLSGAVVEDLAFFLFSFICYSLSLRYWLELFDCISYKDGESYKAYSLMENYKMWTF